MCFLPLCGVPLLMDSGASESTFPRTERGNDKTLFDGFIVSTHLRGNVFLPLCGVPSLIDAGAPGSAFPRTERGNDK